MKCEENGGCPFLGVDTGSSYHEDILACGYFHRTCKTVKDCHLTPDDMAIINVILRGVWRCDTCDSREEGGVYCLLHSINMVHPCGDWQERKEQP